MAKYEILIVSPLMGYLEVSVEWSSFERNVSIDQPDHAHLLSNVITNVPRSLAI